MIMSIYEESSLFDLIYAVNKGDSTAIFFLITKFDKVIGDYANHDEDLKEELIIQLYFRIKNFKI